MFKLIMLQLFIEDIGKSIKSEHIGHVLRMSVSGCKG